MQETKTKVILLLLTIFSVGDAEIVSQPKDTEVVVGNLVYFNCSSSIASEIQWFYYKGKGDQDRSIIYGYDTFYVPFEGRARIEKDAATSTYNLVLNSVTAADAGIFECQDEVGRGTKSSAQLIVLDSNPVCQSNIDTAKVIGSNDCGIEPSILILSCSATFHGNEAPIMRWKKDGNGDVTGKLTNEIRGNRVFYNLSMKAETSMNNSIYSCNATRSISTNNGCNSNTVKIIGTSSDTSCLPCPPETNCQGYSAGIICIIFIILPIVTVAAIALTWYYLYKRFKGAKWDKEKMESIFYCEMIGRCVKHSPSAQKEEEKHLAPSELDENKETIQREVSLDPEDIPNITLRPEVSSENTEDEQLPNETEQSVAKTKEPEEKSERKDDKIITEPQETVKQLKQSLRQKDATINALQATVNKQLKDIQLLNADNEKLRRIIHNLESHLYPSDTIDYAEELKSVQTISLRSKQLPEDAKKDKTEGAKKNKTEGAKKDKTEGAKKDKRDRPAVNGIAVLGKELFVANDQSADVDVFDSETFIFQRNFSVETMQRPEDIASSKDNKCLYIIGLSTDNTQSEIFRITAKGDVLRNWETKGGVGRLSTYESNVIICLLVEQKIYEYTPNGEIITTIALSPGSGFSHPLHAIKVTHMHFVVSHGETKDDIHRVCVVDKEGKIVKIFDRPTWEEESKHTRAKLNVPICLLEDRERRILVVDRDNKKVHLLNSVLKYQRTVIKCKAGMSDVPVRLCFDETSSRIFVAVNKLGSRDRIWKDGLIHILNTKQ